MPAGFRRHLVGKTLRNVSPANSTYYAMLYPQNGDRIVAIDTMTSLRPLCMKQKKH